MAGRELAEKHKIAINVTGIDPLCHFDFTNDLSHELMTFFIYKMLYSGFLAGPRAYTTTAYNNKIISKYMKIVDEAFSEIRQSKKGSLQKKYKFKTKDTGFSRLNYYGCK